MCLELIIHARSVICTRLYSRRDGTVQYLTGRDAQRGRLTKKPKPHLEARVDFTLSSEIPIPQPQPHPLTNNS